MVTTGGIDELNCHTQAIACFTNTTFEQRPHAELLAYCANVGACIAKLKRSGPSCDAKAIKPREGVNEFVSQTLTQVILIAAGTHVRERENCDGRDTLCRCMGMCGSLGIKIREGSHELVSAAMAGFDEAWLFRVILKRPAQFLNARGERVIADNRAIPYRREQVLLCHWLAGVNYKHSQDGGSFRGESKLRCARPQATAVDIELMYAEGDAVLSRFFAHFRYRHNPRQIPENSHDFQISLSILF
jgi:hypothetical protein